MKYVLHTQKAFAVYQKRWRRSIKERENRKHRRKIKCGIIADDSASKRQTISNKFFTPFKFPENFSLQQNYTESIKIILALNNTFHPIISLDLSSIKSIESITGLCLASIISKKLDSGKITVEGNKPENFAVLNYLYELGFYKMFSVDYTDYIDNYKNKHKINNVNEMRTLPFKRLERVDTEEVNSFVKNSLTAEGATVSPTNLKRICEAINEAADNATMHAHLKLEEQQEIANDENDKLRKSGFPYYLSIQISCQTIKVVVCDHGLTIPYKIKENKKLKIKEKNDSQLIAYATQENISTLGNTRGLGLKKMKQLAERFAGTLHIFSGKGSYIYHGKEKTENLLDNIEALIGTTIYWELPINEPIEKST